MDFAVIRMMELSNGQPGVKLETTDAFMELPPIERATFLNAALQLCAMAIGAVIDDHPDEEDEITDRLEAMAIEAQARVTN